MISISPAAQWHWLKMKNLEAVTIGPPDGGIGGACFARWNARPRWPVTREAASRAR